MGESEWFGSEKGSLGFHIVTFLPSVHLMFPFPTQWLVAVRGKVMLRVQFKAVDRLVLRTKHMNCY